MKLPLHCPSCDQPLVVDLDALTDDGDVTCGCGRSRPAKPLVALRGILNDPMTAQLDERQLADRLVPPIMAAGWYPMKKN